MAEQLPVAEEPKGLRVSAILIAYNQAAELRRSIAALEQSSDREQVEIVVVDCGSQDDSGQLDAEFPSVQILRLPQHFGATRAMNIALRTAKAELLLFLSPLVEVQPGTVVQLADKLEADANAAVACPLLTDAEGKPAPQAYLVPTAQDFAAGSLRMVSIDIEKESVAVEYSGRDAMLVRRQALRGMNYFDENFGEYWPELDMAMQIRRAGKKIYVYPSIRATLHEGEDPLGNDSVADADWTNGAARFLGKYQGTAAGMKFKFAAMLKALLSFNFRRFSLLLGGEKMGSQAGR